MSDEFDALPHAAQVALLRLEIAELKAELAQKQFEDAEDAARAYGRAIKRRSSAAKQKPIAIALLSLINSNGAMPDKVALRLLREQGYVISQATLTRIKRQLKNF